MGNKRLWRKQNRSTLDCTHCELTVTRQREDQRFCSDACRVAYHRQMSYEDRMVHLPFRGWIALLGEPDTKTYSREAFRAELSRRLAKLPAWI